MTQFKNKTDRELVELTISGNEAAGVYLVYERYDDDIAFIVRDCYSTLELKPDLVNELYLRLKGRNGDWQPLRNFQWKCQFRTWFNNVTRNLAMEKMPLMIGKGYQYPSIRLDAAEGAPVSRSLTAAQEQNQNKVMLTEAIIRLKNDDYRFILLKEIEGYSAKEVAAMLEEKRSREGTLRRNSDGSLIRPNDKYVHMIKARALKELKVIVQQIKTEWYGD